MNKYIIVQARSLVDLEEKINGYTRDKWFIHPSRDVVWCPDSKTCSVIMEKWIWPQPEKE